MSLHASKLLAEAGELLPSAVGLRRRLHENPELGLDLPDTTRAVLEALEGVDVEIVKSEKTTGLFVTLRGTQPGPGILLRGDMDALPMPEDTGLEFASRHEGRMHACGHDAHTSMLAHAVHLLDRHRDALRGSVTFMFQPGEEGHAGARVMLDEGMLEAVPGIEACFAMHVSPLMPVGVFGGRPGPLLAAADTFQIRLKGGGGHASMPHLSLDPIPVACEIVQALQTFVTRRINAFDPVVLSVSKINAGTTSNVVPETAELLGTLRSTSEGARKLAHEGIERIARQIGAAHEIDVHVEITSGYPVTENDAEFEAFARSTVTDVLGASYFPLPSPAMGAEDFSYVLQRLPGAMVFLGVRPDGVDSPANCHSNRMLLNEDGMRHGIAMHAAIALRYLGAELER